MKLISHKFLWIFVSLLFLVQSASSMVQGIYLSQYTMENEKFVRHLIEQSKKAGINTFVVDHTRVSSAYTRNIKLVIDNKIDYVARIVVFQDGGSEAHVQDTAGWQSRWKLIEDAVALGVKEIQLDYIRYADEGVTTPRKTEKITAIVQWFKEKLKPLNIPLQVDVFGVVAYGPYHKIGQDLVGWAPHIDAVCPMLYPSHFFWDVRYMKNPYGTYIESLNALKKQFGGKVPFKVYPYIQAFSLRLSYAKMTLPQYIQAQIAGVVDGGADGWYAWNAENKYAALFDALNNPQPVERTLLHFSTESLGQRGKK